MILKDFPDVSPRPMTPGNMAFRREFYDRWGKENALVLGTAHKAEFAPHTQGLSIKRAWGGQESYVLEDRQLCVDDEHYLILNAGRTYGASIASPMAVTSMAVFFRPGMAQEQEDAARQSASQVLVNESALGFAPCEFAENLRHCSAEVDALTNALRREVEAGETDEMWLEEQLQRLLWLMRTVEHRHRLRSLALAQASKSNHAELLCRIDRAADYMLSCQADPLTLNDIAQVARLSKYHVVRLFRQVHGVTPFEFLTLARTRTARRLLQATDLSVEDIALRSGLGTRFTLFRQLRKHFGENARGLKDRANRICP